MSDAAAKTAALLKTIWEKNLPVMRERVSVLERAVTDESLRVEAAAVAHKLAGSLGMFGYGSGTEIAREIEVSLTSSAAVDVERLGELVDALKAALPL